MLRGRRLPLPQSPLSRWRTITPCATATATTTTTTTTTATAAARRASYSTARVPDSLESDCSVSEIEVKAHVISEGPKKNVTEQKPQDQQVAGGETYTENFRASSPPAFRKYAITDTKPSVNNAYVYARVPSRYRKLASTGEQPAGQQHDSNLRHHLESVTLGTTQVDSSQLPSVEGDAANEWTEAWVAKVGRKLGLLISKRDKVYFKLSLARELGIKVNDRRLASPAMALAEIEKRAREQAKISIAKDRQGELAIQGTKPIFQPRDRESQQRPNVLSTGARPRLRGVEAKGKAPKVPARTEGSKAAQGSSGDLVGGDLRDRLGDSKLTSVQAGAAKSTRETQDQTESFFQRRGFPAGKFEPDSLSYKGERAPTGIRFTIRPTWLPFDRPNAHDEKVVREANKVKAVHGNVENSTKVQSEDASQGAQRASQVSPAIISSNEEPQPPQLSTDITVEPTGHLNSSAGFVPLSVSRSRPASPHKVDQDQLSMPNSNKHYRQNIYGMLFPEETNAEMKPMHSWAQANTGRKPKSIAKHRSRPNIPDGGIYRKLFPDDFPQQTEPQLQSPSQPEELEPHGLSPNVDTPVPPEDSIFVSLRNEVRNWIPEEQRKRITAPEPGEFASHSTVLILSGLSNSLVDTDFYRILPESKHIEGWAGGLVKVVQARDALSHEPLGRYFLMFHSKPSADAYKAEILRLHALSKRLLYSFTSKSPLVASDTNSQPLFTEAEKADVRSFTLCPPTAPLVINVHMWNTNLVREIARNTNIADVVQALRPDVATPSKVLVTVNTTPGSKAGAGGGLTIDELWLTLRDDGRERGAPWVLSNLKEGIMPVKVMSSTRHGKIDFRSEAVQAPLEGPIYDELDMLAEPPPPPTTNNTDPPLARKVTFDAWHDPNVKKGEKMDKRMFLAPESSASAAKVDREERFNRFVVTFTQPAVSRRFVRSWHKRAIWDEFERRTVSIDAVALM